MFRKATLFSAIVMGILFLGSGFFIAKVRDTDITFIKKQVLERKLARSNTMFSNAEQKRKGVIKDLWVSQENADRLHHRICSDSSLLTIVPHGHKLDLIEKLEHITCWMQDKLYTEAKENSYQQARFLKAQEGFYKYSTQEFLAQSVDLSLYRLPGIDLPLQSVSVKPFLKGIAKDVSFSLEGKSSQFKAQEFKAELNSFEEKK